MLLKPQCRMPDYAAQRVVSVAMITFSATLFGIIRPVFLCAATPNLWEWGALQCREAKISYEQSDLRRPSLREYPRDARDTSMWSKRRCIKGPFRDSTRCLDDVSSAKLNQQQANDIRMWLWRQPSVKHRTGVNNTTYSCKHAEKDSYGAGAGSLFFTELLRAGSRSSCVRKRSGRNPGLP